MGNGALGIPIPREERAPVANSDMLVRGKDSQIRAASREERELPVAMGTAQAEGLA